MDTRYEKLAETLVGFSTKTGRGDRVLLQTDVTVPFDMNLAVIRAVRKAGGIMLRPMPIDQRLLAAAQEGCTKRSLGVDAASYLTTILGTDVRIALRGYMNPFEPSGVPSKDSQRHDRYFTGAVMEEAVEGTRWVVTNWPTPGFAILAGMSTTEAEDFFFRAVLVDYEAMTRSVQPLLDLMRQTKDVRIVGPNTDLAFSIEGIPAIPCTGERNIPDGEAETAPVRDSVNGRIQYNTLTITKTGDRFEGVGFEVRDGKIIDAWCDSGDENRLQTILDTDEGARYFGEFSLGINWGVTRVIGDTLFDEKVGGTFHFTPGKCYDAAPNGNKSAIHWDIVCDQRESAGGGEIFFDGVLVRKNGLFVLDALQGLNPR